MKVLLLSRPMCFYYTKLYVQESGVVNYKFIDGKEFKDLDSFKKKYVQVFKKEPIILEDKGEILKS